MKQIPIYLLAILFMAQFNPLHGQVDHRQEIQELRVRKEQIVEQEKQALKKEVRQINDRLARGEIDRDQADALKAEAAKARALNIENRVAIVDHRIALLERNRGQVLSLGNGEGPLGEKDIEIYVDGERAFGFKAKQGKDTIKYDRRTYWDLVLAIGLNNALVEGQSLDDSPYRVGGSRFFELGWQGRMRVFENSNWLRLHYGISFQFNGLKPEGNRYFVEEGGQTRLEEFDRELEKSKLRMDNLVVPIHFEFGPSKVTKKEHSIRYSIRNQWRFGLGGYGGLSLGTRQKLKYRHQGERIKEKQQRDGNRGDLVYGLSGYLGFDGVLLYLKYDLNPIFKDAEVEQRNISLGLRFDI